MTDPAEIREVEKQLISLNEDIDELHYELARKEAAYDLLCDWLGCAVGTDEVEEA